MSVAPASPVEGAWSVRCDGQLLVVPFAAPLESLSWAIWNGGRRQVPGVVWVGVKNAELPLGVDPRWVCEGRLAAAGHQRCVGLLTSGRLDRFRQSAAAADGVSAQSVATVGLSNAVRVGDPPGPLAPVGTINILCGVSVPLTEEAALEAMSIAVEARTAAVLEARYRSRRSGEIASGTGTDTVVLVWPPASSGRVPAEFAGKHTSLGQVVGQAVGDCVRAGVADWMEAYGCLPG